MMIPVRKGGRIVLRCTKCGFEMELSPSAAKDYTIKEATQSTARVITTSVVSQAQERAIRRREELEQEKEEFYKEIFLELLKEEEYGEGGEEGG